MRVTLKKFESFQVWVTLLILFSFAVYISVKFNKQLESYVLNRVDKSQQRTALFAVETFPPIEPYKCVETAELYGGVKTKICIKEEDKSISGRILTTGDWEGSQVSLVLKAMSKYPDAVFLDVGSNIGMFTVMVAAAGRKVVAVDALLTNLAYVHHSLSLTDTAQFVRLLHHPVSDKAETLFPVSDNLSNPGGTRLIPEHQIADQNVVGPPVNTTTLLDILHFINTETVIIKIDVEGYECKVLDQYIQKKTTTYIPYIIMEWRHVKDNLDSNCPNLPGLVEGLYNNNYLPYDLPDFTVATQIELTLQQVERADLNSYNEMLWAHKDATQL